MDLFGSVDELLEFGFYPVYSNTGGIGLDTSLGINQSIWVDDNRGYIVGLEVDYSSLKAYSMKLYYEQETFKSFEGESKIIEEFNLIFDVGSRILPGDDNSHLIRHISMDVLSGLGDCLSKLDRFYSHYGLCEEGISINRNTSWVHFDKHPLCDYLMDVDNPELETMLGINLDISY